MEKDEAKPLLVACEMAETKEASKDDVPLFAHVSGADTYDSCSDSALDGSDKPGSSSERKSKMATLPADQFGWLYAAFLLINFLVGGGMLTFPSIIPQSGGPLPFAVLMIIGGMVALAGIMVTGLATQIVTPVGSDSSCGQLSETYLGRVVCVFVNVLMAVACFGNSTAYMNAIYGFVRVILRSFQNDYINSHPSISCWVTVAVFILIIFPMCLVGSVGKLKRVSALMAVNIAYVVGLSVYFWVRHQLLSEKAGFKIENCKTEWKPAMIIDALPAIFFAFAGVTLAPNVAAGLEPKGPAALGKTTATAVGFAFICYTVVGIGLYTSFPCSLKSNLFEMLPENEWPVVLGTFLYTVKLACEFPLMWFIAKTSLLDMVVLFHSLRSQEGLDKKTEYRIRTVLTIIITPISVVIALTTPELIYLVSMTGIFWIILAFVLPAVIYLKMVQDEYRSKEKGIKYWMLVVLGGLWVGVMVGLFVLTVAESIIKLKK